MQATPTVALYAAQTVEQLRREVVRRSLATLREVSRGTPAHKVNLIQRLVDDD